jgi:hypothetical protein
MFLVPAIMKLLGDYCWWAPKWMKRLQHKIGLGETTLPDERKRGVVAEPAEALAGAVAAAEGRLLATRIQLTGATTLHGSLHREAQHWRAQVQALAQDFGEESVWVERLRIGTSPVYDLAELAARDALTKTVLDSLETTTHNLAVLPDDITEMLDVLPSELRTEVAAEWEPDQLPALMEEVRAIILEALQTKGGNEP